METCEPGAPAFAFPVPQEETGAPSFAPFGVREGGIRESVLGWTRRTHALRRLGEILLEQFPGPLQSLFRKHY